MIFIRKNSKGHNSVENVDGIRFLVFCTSSDVYICTKFHENILDGYRANTIYIAKISKGHNSVENVVGITVLFLCK